VVRSRRKLRLECIALSRKSVKVLLDVLKRPVAEDALRLVAATQFSIKRISVRTGSRESSFKSLSHCHCFLEQRRGLPVDSDIEGVAIFLEDLSINLQLCQCLLECRALARKRLEFESPLFARGPLRLRERCALRIHRLAMLFANALGFRPPARIPLRSFIRDLSPCARQIVTQCRCFRLQLKE
jgi:hypothetical protein